jgi:serine phosphatase RsbU (regulator of sigma subunit)
VSQDGGSAQGTERDAPDRALSAGAAPDRGARGRRAYTLAVVVALVGMLVSGALTLVSQTQYTSNEKRLLALRSKELVDVLTLAVPNTESPLSSAAALAEATNGDPRKFADFIAPFVGPRKQFVSVSLWPLGTRRGSPLTVLGAAPAIARAPRQRAALFARAARTAKLAILGLLRSRVPRLGYAVAAGGHGPHFAVYGESALPASRRSRLQSNTAFSDLNYAIYLGPRVTSAQLLVTNLSALPVRGRQARQAIPFGDTVLTVVVAPRVPLGGALPQRLPWIILVVGILLSLGAAALTARLIQGRLDAEHLAGELELAVHENQELYTEQRTIAQTLQQALLPAELPQLAGTETSALYEPGEQGVEIGGDWYDVIPLDDHRLLTVVGDVSGRGLRAATTMASLRYAIHAYAAQSDAPATILTRLSELLSVTTSGQFATVLCTVLDTSRHEVTVASAGHLPPLLLAGGRGEYLQCSVGPPIGVQTGVRYASMTVAVPPAATLLAYTDGLVERRGESIDDGLTRLRDAAQATDGDLTGLLSHLVNDLRHGYSDDDTAIVGLRWTA